MDFILRNWSIHDINSVLKYANNKKIADNLRNGFPHPYTQQDAEAFIRMMIEIDPSKAYCVAIEVNNEAVGSIGVFLKEDVYEKSGEIGYWLAEPFWGQGITHKAVNQVCDYVFNNYGIIRIFAEPYAHNIGSCKVLEKAGFKLEGIMEKSVFKNNVLCDSCMYAKITPSITN